MNQNQQRYAMKRIDDALRDKIEDLKEKHTKPGKQLTDKQKIELIRQGEASIPYSRRTFLTMKSTLGEAFDFSSRSPAEVLDLPAFEKARKALNKEASKIRDKIMLGDAKAAIPLIEKFCQ